MKMDKKTIKFDDTEIEEYNCHQHKNPISRNNIDINKVVISNKQELKKYEYVFSNNEI